MRFRGLKQEAVHITYLFRGRGLEAWPQRTIKVNLGYKTHKDPVLNTIVEIGFHTENTFLHFRKFTVLGYFWGKKLWG